MRWRCPLQLRESGTHCLWSIQGCANICTGKYENICAGKYENICACKYENIYAGKYNLIETNIRMKGKNKAILRKGVMSDFLRLGVEMVVDGRVVKRRDGEGWPEERRPYHLLQNKVVGSSKSPKA